MKEAKQERERILKIINKWLNEIAIRQEGEPTISNSDYEELKKEIKHKEGIANWKKEELKRYGFSEHGASGQV